MILFVLAFLSQVAAAPLSLDLSNVSEADIARTVLHLQSLVRDAEASVQMAESKTQVATSQLIIVQQKFDALKAHDAMETKLKWRWFGAFAGSAFLNLLIIVLWLRK